jgi:hypothetical protein
MEELYEIMIEFEKKSCPDGSGSDESDECDEGSELAESEESLDEEETEPEEPEEESKSARPLPCAGPPVPCRGKDDIRSASADDPKQGGQRSPRPRIRKDPVTQRVKRDVPDRRANQSARPGSKEIAAGPDMTAGWRSEGDEKRAFSADAKQRRRSVPSTDQDNRQLLRVCSNDQLPRRASLIGSGVASGRSSVVSSSDNPLVIVNVASCSESARSSDLVGSRDEITAEIPHRGLHARGGIPPMIETCSGENAESQSEEIRLRDLEELRLRGLESPARKKRGESDVFVSDEDVSPGGRLRSEAAALARRLALLSGGTDRSPKPDTTRSSISDLV